MSSVSTALALVLDGIAMSAKTSTSLKKALSYRAVEILLVDNHGLQKVSLQSPLGSCADVSDCQQVAEVFDDEKIPVHAKQDDYKTRHDLKSKYDKEFKFKKAKAKTLETINTANMKMEHMMTDEQGKQVTEHSIGEVAKTKESIKTAKLKIDNEKLNEQNLQAEYVQLVADVRELIRMGPVSISECNSVADIEIKAKAWIQDIYDALDSLVEMKVWSSLNTS